MNDFTQIAQGIPPDKARSALKLAMEAGDKDAVDFFTNVVRVQTGQEFFVPEQMRMASLPEVTDPGAQKLQREMTHPTQRTKLPMNEGGLRAHSRNVANSVGLGAQDEVAGAIGATLNAVTGATPGTWGETYEGIRDQEREQQRRYRDNHPVLNAAGQVVGPIVPLRAGARAIDAATNAYGAVRTVPAIGAGVGGGQAFGLAEGPWEDQAKQALLGAGMGGVGGSASALAATPVTAAAQYAGRVGRRGLSVDERVRAVIRDQQEVAGTDTGQQVRRLGEMEGNTQAVADGGHPSVAPGFLPENQPLMRGAVVPSGAAGDTSELALRHAQRQTAEVSEAVEVAAANAGVTGNLRQTIENINNRQRTNAGPVYREAYDHPTQPLEVPAIADQLGDQVVLRALAAGREALALEGKKPRQLLRRIGTDGDGNPTYKLIANPTWEEIDLVQRGMRRKAEAARINEPSMARRWGNRRADFLSAVDEANGPFARARRIWAGEEAVKEAAERGGSLFKARDKDWDADDLQVEFQRYTPSERQAFMSGVVKALRNAVEGKRQQTNTGGQLEFSSIENLSRLRTVLGNDAADQLLSEVQRTSSNVAAARKTTTTSGTPESMYATDAMGDMPTGVGMLDFMRMWGRNTGLASDPQAMNRMAQVMSRMSPQQYGGFMSPGPFAIGPQARNLWDAVRTPGATAAAGAGMSGELFRNPQ